MRRREFVAGLEGESVAFPLATRAQQPKQMPLVGVLQDLAESEPVARSEVIAFREVLASAMYSRIDSAQGRPTRLPPARCSSGYSCSYDLTLGNVSNLSRIATVSEDPRRRRDHKGGDDEREHWGVDRRMNQEKRTGCGADDKRDKDTAQSAVLFAG
jgi:hypothetical protein